MSRFEADTAVTPNGDRSFDVTIDDGWWVVGAPNGGYLAGMVARAIEAAANPEVPPPSEEFKRIRSITFHFLRAPKPGPARIDISIERIGRSVATLTARLVQADAGGEESPQVFAVAALGTQRSGPEWNDLVAPEFPMPEDVADAAFDPELVEVAKAMGLTIGLRYALKPWVAPAVSKPTANTESEADTADEAGAAVTGGWIRFRDDAPIDRLALIAMSDAWAPPIINKFPGRAPVAPTVELTVHVRNEVLDPTDWVFGRFGSPLAQDGYTVEDGELWDRHGRLLATARQIAVVP